VRQAAPGKVQDLPAGPVGVSGRLLTSYGEDRFRVPVRPKTKLLLEVFAERYGSPLDAALVVRNEQGAELARAEDGPDTLDPTLEYAVPDKVTSVIVGVADAQGRGGTRAVYRLVVDPGGTARGRCGFKLFTPIQGVAVPAADRAVVPVLIDRAGYDGRIELSAEGLPGGARLDRADIPAGADGALVTVRHDGDAPGTAITHWRGRTADGEDRAVIQRGHPLERLQPWLATELAVAAVQAADFQIDWRGLSADAGLVPAMKRPLPVRVTKLAGGVVRLTLLTSQRPPVVNGQPDLQQSLRLEKPVEVPAGATDGDLTLLVPPQLPAPVYDVTVRAELLGPEKTTVQATAYAPVRRMAVRLPVAVHLEGPTRVEATLAAGSPTTVKLQGHVERREGLTGGDVSVVLLGLPKGVRADPVRVKAGATAFTLSVVLSPGVPAGEITGLKLFASAAPDAQRPDLRVRSRTLELTLVVRAAAQQETKRSKP
jgi:hypothetical protein